MTQNSTHIASPLTFGEISGHPVAIDMFEQVHQWDVEHIALATWADAYGCTSYSKCNWKNLCWYCR